MTPKEKAKELAEKMYSTASPYNYEGISWYEVIDCALIAVDEIIIELTQEISPSVHGFRHNYWKEVKEEIEKL